MKMTRNSLMLSQVRDEGVLHRVSNAAIEEQLFSKTCRPGSLASNSVFGDSRQVPTPKASGSFHKTSFSCSLMCGDLESFVNLKRTVSEVEDDVQVGRAFVKRNKPRIADHFAGIAADSFIKMRNTVEPDLFESNEPEPKGQRDLENTEEPAEEERTERERKCEWVVDACTSEVLKLIYQDAVDELAKKYVTNN